MSDGVLNIHQVAVFLHFAVAFNIMTSSGVMTIFIYKELTRNPEIGNAPSKFCAISADWGKLGANVFNKMLFNGSKCQGCNFYLCELVREN